MGRRRPLMVCKKWEAAKEGGRRAENSVQRELTKLGKRAKKGATKNEQKDVKNLVINLVNVHGLTKPKILELEQLLARECDFMCLTETQQIYDRYELSKGIGKIESMREKKDKKGGALLLMYKIENLFGVNKVQTSHSDVLHVAIQVAREVLHIVLVYFSVVSNQEHKVRNETIKKEVEKIIAKVKEEHEAIMILGDFNEHIGSLGKQREDENGRTVLEWINEYGMILLNLDEGCNGLFTWQRREQRSVIDFVMVNNTCYEWFEEMIIDEDQEKFDLLDHNMITVILKLPVMKNKNFNRGKAKVVEYYKTNEEALQKYADEVC